MVISTKKNAILLGRLGDVVLLSRLSNSVPHQISLITSPEYVQIARELGKFRFVNDYLSFANIKKSTGEIFVDLHNKSLEITKYRDCIRLYSISIASTQDRSEWLGITPSKYIRRRKHKDEPLASYWSKQLELELFLSPPDTSRLIENTNKTVTTLLSFQSSARHKTLGHSVVNALLQKLSNENKPFKMLLGPGEVDECRFLCEIAKKYSIDIYYANNPNDLARIFLDRCVLISVDNGVRHLAGAYGIPRIVIYGPTSPTICGSGDEVAVVSSTKCAPCGCVESCPFELLQNCLSDHGIIDIVYEKWRWLIHG